MKKSLSYFLCCLIISVLFLIDPHKLLKLNNKKVVSSKYSSTQYDDAMQFNKLIKENIKLNRTIYNQLEELSYMNQTIQILRDEKEELKTNLTNSLSEIEKSNQKIEFYKKRKSHNFGKGKEVAKAISDINSLLTKISNYHYFFEQMKMKMIRENEMNKVIEAKYREISQTEKDITSLYKEITSMFRNKIGDVSKMVSALEKSNFNNNERLYQVEKELTKDHLREVLQKTAIQINSDNFYKDKIEPECNRKNSCSLCVDDPKCVWCSIDKKCVLGSSKGPTDGSCTLSFEYGSCPQIACNTINSCVNCMKNIDCGWCKSTKRCIDRNEYSLTSNYCPVDYIHSKMENDVSICN